MKLTKEQLEQYEEQGFLFIPEYFSQEEVAVIRNQIPALRADDSIKQAWEDDNKTLRALIGVHTNEFIRNLVRHPRLLEAAKQLIDSDIYVFTTTLVMKSAFTGGGFEWHQDFAYMNHLHGVPFPEKITSVLLFLDEVNEFNGATYLIPGSHKEGALDLKVETDDVANAESSSETDKKIGYNADTGYNTPTETLTKLAQQQGIVAPKGVAGSVVFFHGLIFHGATTNISPFERRVLVLHFNGVDNLPDFRGEPELHTFVNRDFTPLKPLMADETALLFSASTQYLQIEAERDTPWTLR